MMGVRQNKSNSRPFSRITLAWVSIQLSTLFLVPVALNSCWVGSAAAYCWNGWLMLCDTKLEVIADLSLSSSIYLCFFIHIYINIKLHLYMQTINIISSSI